MDHLSLRLRELAKAEYNVLRIQHELYLELGHDYDGSKTSEAAHEVIEEVTWDLGDAYEGSAWREALSEARQKIEGIRKNKNAKHASARTSSETNHTPDTRGKRVLVM